MTSVAGEIPVEVTDYLGLHHVITLSTSSFTGMPHADTVVFTSDHQRIYFFAAEGSTVIRNVRDSRYVSFTIDDYTTDWRKVRELQGVGSCLPGSTEDEAWVITLSEKKYGDGFVRPTGLLFALRPGEMHFVDYDYATVAGQSSPDVTSRVYQIGDTPAPPKSGPISTTLDQSTFEAGDVIFRPGDRVGQYFIVLDGEVEIRGEGFGSDQTVTRVSSGQLFGDQASLRGQRGALTAHAVSRTHLMAVQREAIRDLLLSADSE
jgi:hypothetical protein